MNYDKIIEANYDYLFPILRAAYEKEFGGHTVFLAGNGVFLGYPNYKKGIDNFITFSYSKAKLKTLLSGTSLTIKSNMSKKVTLLVWNEGSWYHKGEFEKYDVTRITWKKFLQVMADTVDRQIDLGNIQ